MLSQKELHGAQQTALTATQMKIQQEQCERLLELSNLFSDYYTMQSTPASNNIFSGLATIFLGSRTDEAVIKLRQYLCENQEHLTIPTLFSSLNYRDLFSFSEQEQNHEQPSIPDTVGMLVEIHQALKLPFTKTDGFLPLMHIVYWSMADGTLTIKTAQVIQKLINTIRHEKQKLTPQSAMSSDAVVSLPAVSASSPYKTEQTTTSTSKAGNSCRPSQIPSTPRSKSEEVQSYHASTRPSTVGATFYGTKNLPHQTLTLLINETALLCSEVKSTINGYTPID